MSAALVSGSVFIGEEATFGSLDFLPSLNRAAGGAA
jgi:hypothetical protein